MNTGRLIAGIICLILAGILAVANLVLPLDRLMFTVGEANMPWVPAIILGIVGIALLATAVGGQKEPAQAEQPEIIQDEGKAALNKRLETIGWGLFLVMLGGFALVPKELVSKDFWSIGIGLIMLGLNAARYFNGIKMSGFTTVLGIIALLSGTAQLLGMEMLEGALFLIILGAYLLLKPYFDKRQLFGKAEES
jgi:hypothetical protein